MPKNAWKTAKSALTLHPENKQNVIKKVINNNQKIKQK
jgi:hypothetical protein